MGGPVWHAMDGAVQPGRPPAYFIADEEAFQVPAGRPVVGVSSDLKAELRRCVPSPQPVGSADGRTAAASGNAGGRDGWSFYRQCAAGGQGAKPPTLTPLFSVPFPDAPRCTSPSSSLYQRT